MEGVDGWICGLRILSFGGGGLVRVCGVPFGDGWVVEVVLRNMANHGMGLGAGRESEIER